MSVSRHRYIILNVYFTIKLDYIITNTYIIKITGVKRIVSEDPTYNPSLGYFGFLLIVLS